MAVVEGFWSYVHADDEGDGERIQRLARDVRAQFEMLTGEPIDLFLDRDGIEWGERWRHVVDERLSSVAFFIPVLTPRYFLSAECRRELQAFARQARDLGVRELVMPLLYVEVPALHEEDPADELAVLVKEFHWEDWRELRFADVDSSDYRRNVARLASRLVEANRLAESVPIATAATEGDTAVEAEEGDLGFIDRLAEMEEAMPQWKDTIEALTAELEGISAIMQAGTDDITERDARGAGFAGRLAAARRTAHALAPVAERVLELSSEFTAQLHSVDRGIRTLIDLAPEASDGEARRRACEFFDSVRTLAESSREGFGALDGMIESSEPLERMSRDLRRPLRVLRQGLTAMSEAGEITQEWTALIDASPLDCG